MCRYGNDRQSVKLEVMNLNRQQAHERQAISNHHLQHVTAHHFLDLGEAWERTEDTGSKERNPAKENVKGSRRMVVRKSDARKILRKGTPKKIFRKTCSSHRTKKMQSDEDQKIVSSDKTVQRNIMIQDTISRWHGTGGSRGIKYCGMLKISG